jgi:hypothetical protein
MARQALAGGGGVFTGANLSAINANFAELYGWQLQSGTAYFCDAVNGNDSADGLTAATALSTLSAAYSKCVSGNNDIVVLVGNGGTGGTQRLSTGFTWSKNATHLVGICSPVLYSQRARIAPTSGAAAFTPFFTISGSGCIFQNIQWFHGFGTGTTAQINMVLTGSRNYFQNCHIAGMGDTASGADAGSRSIKIGAGGSGENVFESCVIGLDTVARSAANASVEFTGNTVRNAFRNCLFPFYATASTALGYIGTGAACVDRNNSFENCSFINSLKSGSGTGMAGLGTFSSASAGGLLFFHYCSLVGISEFGTDATSRGLCYVDSGTVTAATAGIAVNPT